MTTAWAQPTPGARQVQQAGAPQNPLVTELLHAPDAAARDAWLDAHPADVNDALRDALRDEGDRLRSQGHLPESVTATIVERMVAVRLHDPHGIVIADWGTAQADSLLGDYDGALAVLRDAQEVAASMHDEKLQRQTLGNVAIIYRLRGNLDQAIELQRQLLKAFEADHDTRGLGRTLNNISILQEQRGEYRDALASAQRSLTLEEPGTLPYSRTLHALGNIYLAQGELDLAFDAYRQEIAQRDQDAPAKVANLEMLGEVERMRRHFDEATGYLAQARAIAEAAHQLPQVAFSLRIEALVRMDRGDNAGAVPLMERSLEIGRAIKDPDIISYTLTNLALLRRKLGDPATALELAREAIALGDSQPAHGLAQAYREAGRAYMALGQREEARHALQSAIDIIEDLRDQVSGGGIERQQFFEHTIEPYQAMMTLLLDEGANEAALGFAERTRARALLDEMQRGHVDLARALTPDEREQERAIERRLQKAKGPARIPVRGELAALRVRLYAAHPELRLARGAADIPSLPQLKELVPDPSTVVLAYAAVEDRTWLFVVSTSPQTTTPTLAVHRLAIDNDTLATRVHHLRDSLANRSLDFSTDARALYADLLQPAADAVRRAKRLVIIPDGVLWDLPFQVLQSPTAPHQYIVERTIVEYAPSLTYLWAAHHAPTTAAPRDGLRDLLAVGNPQFEHEPRALAALYGPRKTTLLIGPAATEQRVKTDAGRYRVVHFATHGVLDDRDPMYSAVLLAPAAKDDADDGRLEARELMDLHLNADLVVLSACDTARGRYGAGEGLLGLSWAMLLAGSRDVVVSQWKVDATSTSQLMIAFHRTLVHQPTTPGPDIGAALQLAAREVMHDPRYRHPFYWAAFRTVGVGH